jgi:hypothetical protein
MTTPKHLITAITLLLPCLSQAQFTSGSNGSYGPLNVTAYNTVITTPPDGIFHCTTVNISSGSVSFTRNAKNTPIYILATGDVTITGDVSVSGAGSSGANGGLGGPGGYSGGNGGMGGLPAGDGQGPGGGRAGDASYNTSTSAAPGGYGGIGSLAVSGPVYGSPLLVPLIGGSGGGGVHGSPGVGGGGGGGAILIASSTKIRMTNGGEILARGGSAGEENPGSGGAIRLVAPEVVLEYGFGLDTASGYGGRGRVRIDGIVRQIANFYNVSTPYTVGANMVVFPPNMPDLKIVQAASQTIDPASAAPVNVTLPSGTAAVQPVRVRAQNFNGTAQVIVQLTPESGSASTYTLDIPNPGPGPAEATVNVTFPVNVLTRVDVWTR